MGINWLFILILVPTSLDCRDYELTLEDEGRHRYHNIPKLFPLNTVEGFLVKQGKTR